MGYTHYFELKTDLTEEALQDIRQRLEKYADLIQYETNNNKEPKADLKGIRFNGKGDWGYETFMVKKGRDEFCKTNQYRYDLVVCEVLLLLKHHFKDQFDLTSDGFWVSEDEYKQKQFDGYWNEALENIQEAFGYNFDLEGEISGSPGREYYQLLIR